MSRQKQKHVEEEEYDEVEEEDTGPQLVEALQVR